MVYTFEERHALLALLREHISQNVIKIGKQFYRQKQGIPQGSILSTLLCNFYYGEIERKELKFVGERSSRCLLMRYVDDFLLITTDLAIAKKFLKVMRGGK